MAAKRLAMMSWTVEEAVAFEGALDMKEEDVVEEAPKHITIQEVNVQSLQTAARETKARIRVQQNNIDSRMIKLMYIQWFC